MSPLTYQTTLQKAAEVSIRPEEITAQVSLGIKNRSRKSFLFSLRYPVLPWLLFQFQTWQGLIKHEIWLHGRLSSVRGFTMW